VSRGAHLQPSGCLFDFSKVRAGRGSLFNNSPPPGFGEIFGEIERALEWSAHKCLRNWLRGVDLNHRPLGYEDSSLTDSIEFQGLDAAGNDRKSLE